MSVLQSRRQRVVKAGTGITVTNAGNNVTVAIDAAVVLALAYPVGCIYFSTNSTNPATSLGFGTWSAFGAGKVPVGFSSGETEFDTDEETGGAKTNTLAIAEMPLHDHGVLARDNAAAFGANPRAAHGTNTGSIIVDTSNATGGGGAHNNLQPYIVVRMWKRTA